MGQRISVPTKVKEQQIKAYYEAIQPKPEPRPISVSTTTNLNQNSKEIINKIIESEQRKRISKDILPPVKGLPEVQKTTTVRKPIVWLSQMKK